jgi:hypothetical protein
VVPARFVVPAFFLRYAPPILRIAGGAPIASDSEGCFTRNRAAA